MVGAQILDRAGLDRGVDRGRHANQLTLNEYYLKQTPKTSLINRFYPQKQPIKGNIPASFCLFSIAYSRLLRPDPVSRLDFARSLCQSTGHHHLAADPKNSRLILALFAKSTIIILTF